MAETRVRIGLSGWTYDHWKDSFYAGIPKRRWLAHCAERFSVMEVNATFYRFMAESTFAKWRDETPDDFAFILKGHKGITQNRKLNRVEDLVERMRDSARPLAAKTRAILWQLPPNLGKDIDRLGAFA